MNQYFKAEDNFQGINPSFINRALMEPNQDI